MSKRSPAQQMESILPTLIYIQTHLDNDSSLEKVAAYAALSPFHFHRLFRVTVGETLKKYTQRLRLERAAFDMKLCDATIMEVALGAGFRSHETFSRAFKKHFGRTPRSYQQNSRLLVPTDDTTEQMVSRTALNSLTVQYQVSRIRVQKLAPLPVAFIRHLGAYEAVDMDIFNQLLSWAQRRRLYTGDNLLLGIGHDDPGITEERKLRFDACLQVPGPFSVDGRIGYQTTPAGWFAAVTYVGPYGPVMTEAYNVIFQQIMQLRRYRLLGLPAVEIYRTTQITPDAELNETDIYLPVEEAMKVEK